MTRKKDVNPNQLSIVSETVPGSLAIQGEIKGTLSRMLRKSDLSRYQVAAQVSELVGYEVSKSMLDNYTAESHDDVRVPADVIVAAGIVCRDSSAMVLLCGAAGGEFVSGDELEYVALAKIQKDILKLQTKERELKARLIG